MIISFSSMKGGVGKTTLSSALAIELGKLANTVLVDMDPEQNSASMWVSMRAELDGVNHVATARLVDTRRLRELEDSYDFVVVDSRPYSPGITRSLAQISGLMVLPTSASLSDIVPATDLATKQRQHEETNTDCVACMNNILSDAEAWRTRTLLAAGGMDVLNGWISGRISHRMSMNQGHTITENIRGGLAEQAGDTINEIIERASPGLIDSRKNVHRLRVGAV